MTLERELNRGLERLRKIHSGLRIVGALMPHGEERKRLMALCDGLNADIAVAQALVAQVGPALAAAAATTSTADAAAVAAADAQVQQLIAALQAAGISVPVPAAPTGQ